MNASAFKMLLGIGQIIIAVIAPYAAGMPFSIGTLVLNLLGVLTGSHAITSAVQSK